MPANRIFNHRHEGGTAIGIKHAVETHIDITPDLPRVGGAIAVLRIGAVIAEEINGLPLADGGILYDTKRLDCR